VRKVLLGALLLGSMAFARAQNDKPLPSAPEAQLKLHGEPEPTYIVNNRAYQQPTRRQFFHSYLVDTYGPFGFLNTTIRALYAEGRDKPSGWGQNAAGFGQRYGSAFAVTTINGTVRYGMENIFREDLRYIPCHGCTARHKIENALLAEITARHNSNGKRFFTLTPVIADFSGPIITHTLWYPGSSSGPLSGVISVRTVVVTRVGLHLFREFVLERRHHDVKELDRR
jgi:hypothetical protein